jgi:ATP-dependent DNA helicase RecG
MEAVRGFEPTRRALGSEGVFVRQGIIPEDAWLEGIVNAIVHRSYSLGGDHIRVEIFDDRLEIESPGRFPGLVNLDDPRGVVRFARNPRIARVCADLDFGQELGEGIRRMFEEMRARGLAAPLYTQTVGTVRLTLSAAMIDPRLAATLPEGYLAIIDAIRRGGNLSTGDLCEFLKLSRPATLRRLNSLQEAGLIDWVGKSSKDPRAFWRLHSE